MNMDEQIVTSRLILRPFAEADAGAVSHNSRQPIAARFLSDMVLDTEVDARGWINWINVKRNINAPLQVLAVVKKDDEKVIGLVGVGPKKELDGQIEILFMIADQYQNSGYATEAGKAIIWWAFEKAGQDVLCAIVKPENAASRRVIEKLGFVYGDTRTLEYDGAQCIFDCFQFFRTDDLPGPEWDARSLYKPERMGAFFDARARGYDAHMLSDGGEDAYRKLADAIPATDEAIRALDLGCGTGIELDYIWEKAPGAHATCVDVSRGMLDLLIKNHAENKARISVVEASYLDWRYPESAYDLIISSQTLHHLWPEEKIKVYRDVLHTLKPGGTYVEHDFIVDRVMAEQYRRRHALMTASLPGGAWMGKYHIDIPCALDEQVKLLRNAGFQTVEAPSTNIKPQGKCYAILRARK